MIAVDSSALVAVAIEEADAERFLPLLAGDCVAGWTTIFEARLVLSGKPSGLTFLNRWIERPQVVCHPFDATLYPDAIVAFERFGRGRHPAKLNFGDCMSYAVAKHYAVPLLYKGGDFVLTDIQSALP